MPRKVLIARPGAMGDVCMAVPFVAALQRHCEVHWLIRPAYLPLPRAFLPEPCRLIPLTPETPHSPPGSVGPPEFSGDFIAMLRQERYDAVLDLSHWPLVARLVAGLGEVPVRGITYDPRQDALLYGTPGNNDLYGSYNRLVEISPGWHQLEKWQALAGSALGVDLPLRWPLPPSRAGRRPLHVFVHPHASKANKHWHPRDFATVLRRLARDRLLVCHINSGARNEFPRALGLWARLLAAGIRARVVLLERSYQRLCEVLRRCDLALGCDSGPMHLAALVGTPGVVIYGPYPAGEFGPRWRSLAVEPAGPGRPARHVEPDRVLAAVRATLDPARRPGGWA